MKKFIKKLGYLCVILCIIAYIIINEDQVENVINIADVYIKSAFEKQIEYDNTFKVNDIKVNINNYYYEKLNDNQKNIYKSIIQGIKKLDNKVILKDYKYEKEDEALKDIEVAFNYLCLDHPEIFYLDNNYSVSNITSIVGNKSIIDLKYTVNNVDELNSKINSINEVIEGYLEDMKSSDNAMDLEIALHDKLASNVTYYKYDDVNKIPYTCHTIEGAFLEKQAVCDGLSKAIQILLSNVDIENIVVLGKLDGNPHAWNMVNLNNNWYNLDITSDKSIKSADDKNIVIHAYFNISDELILNTHDFDEKKALPKSEIIEDSYNYYKYYNKYVYDEENVKEKLGQIIDENTNETLLEVCSDTIDNLSNHIYEAIVSKDKNEYLDENRFKYYKVFDVYIILRN